MFTILDYSSALEYSIIRRYTNIVYYYLMCAIASLFMQFINVIFFLVIPRFKSKKESELI